MEKDFLDAVQKVGLNKLSTQIVKTFEQVNKSSNDFHDFQKYQEMITFLFHGIDNYINYRHKESYSPYKNNTAYSYSTNDQHRADCPIILFDYIQDKQDTLMHIDWVKKLWN